MKLVIDIPKEFEEHFKFDRFDDSLGRIETDIQTLRCKRMSGTYEQETISMLHKAFVDAVPFVEESKTADLIILQFNCLMGEIAMEDERNRILNQIDRDGVVFLPYYMSVAYIGNKCDVEIIKEGDSVHEDTADTE